MKQKLYYCTNCNKETDTKTEIIEENYTVKGENVIVKSRVRYCAICGEEIWDEQYADETITSANNEYRRIKGLLSSIEIKDIRLKYNLTQTAFSKLLGFGEKTIARYENGALQERAQDNLIRLMDDVYIFKKLWFNNKHLLSQTDIKRTEAALNDIGTVEISKQAIYIMYPNSNGINYPYKYSSSSSGLYELSSGIKGA